MMTYDIEFSFYSDEPPKYFSRQADEFDGYDPQGPGANPGSSSKNSQPPGIRGERKGYEYY